MPLANDMAYPVPDRSVTPNNSEQLGLTKRELFAAMAMQGLLSNLAAIRAEGFKDSEIEEFAVMRADALCAALSESPKNSLEDPCAK